MREWSQRTYSRLISTGSIEESTVFPSAWQDREDCLIQEELTFDTFFPKAFKNCTFVNCRFIKEDNLRSEIPLIENKELRGFKVKYFILDNCMIINCRGNI